MPDDLSLIWAPRPVMPPLWTGIKRGISNRCPMCGSRPLFNGYLRVVGRCRQCHTALGIVPADDAPPYFTILLVGHLIVPLLVVMEKTVAPPLWIEAAIFLPLTAALSLALLRPIKGATVAWLLQHGSPPDQTP